MQFINLLFVGLHQNKEKKGINTLFLDMKAKPAASTSYLVHKAAQCFMKYILFMNHWF